MIKPKILNLATKICSRSRLSLFFLGLFFSSSLVVKASSRASCRLSGASESKRSLFVAQEKLKGEKKIIIVSLRERTKQLMWKGSLQRKLRGFHVVSFDFKDFLDSFQALSKTSKKSVVALVVEANSEPAGKFDVAQALMNSVLGKISTFLTSDLEQDPARAFREVNMGRVFKLRQFGEYCPSHFAQMIQENHTS